MRLRAATRTTRQGVEARLLRALGTERRRRLVTELVRVAGAVSAPSAQGALHRARAAQALVRPTNHKLDEIHTRGLYAVVRETARVDGAIVECGISHGKSLLSLARAAELFGPDKVVFGFDPFAGFPAAVAEDVGTVSRPWGCSRRFDRHFPRTRLQPPGTHQRNLFPAFSKTPWRNSPPPAHQPLHLDCDMYEYTATALRVCAPRAEGGIVILDGYREDRWPGATRVIDEVFGSKEICWEPALARFGVRV